MNFANFYDSVGPAGLALVALACAALYLGARNLLFLHFVWRDFQRDFLDMGPRPDGSMGEVCETSSNPLVAVVRDIVKTHGGHSKDVRAEVAYLFHRNFESVTKGLCWLRFISVVSPLLGLLGTVLGMLTVFQTIEAEASPGAAMLAGGIWQALLTTVMGLCVALPTLMAYYYLTLKFKGFHIEAVEHSYRALELCSGLRGEDAPVHEGLPGMNQKGMLHV